MTLFCVFVLQVKKLVCSLMIVILLDIPKLPYHGNPEREVTNFYLTTENSLLLKVIPLIFHLSLPHERVYYRGCEVLMFWRHIKQHDVRDIAIYCFMFFDSHSRKKKVLSSSAVEK